MGYKVEKGEWVKICVEVVKFVEVEGEVVMIEDVVIDVLVEVVVEVFVEDEKEVFYIFMWGGCVNN